MLVYLTATAVALFYLMHVPVRAAAEIALGGENRARLGVGVFGRARIWTLERPLSLAPLLKKRPSAGLGKALRRALGYLKRHGKIARLDVRVGLGDACQTALICGLLRSALLPVTRRARVLPAFEARGMRARALCIADVCLGHIMVAALLCASNLIIWRVRTWISGRLKVL